MATRNKGDQVASSLFGGFLFQPNFLPRAAKAVGEAFTDPTPMPSMSFAGQESALAKTAIDARNTPLIQGNRTAQGGLPPVAPQLPSGINDTGRFDYYNGAPPAGAAPSTASSASPMAQLAQPPPAFPATAQGQTFTPAFPVGTISSQTAPRSPLADKNAIQTPYGTVYATQEQAGRQNVQEMGQLAPQAARLANIGNTVRQGANLVKAGAAGERIGQQQFNTMKAFGDSRAVGSGYTASASGRFGQPLKGLFPKSQRAIAAGNAPQPNQKVQPMNIFSSGFESMTGFTNPFDSPFSFGQQPPQSLFSSLTGNT